MIRAFYVLHTHGTTEELAESAAQALKQAFIPGGFQNALAVVDASLVIRGAAEPFCAVIGEPIDTQGGTSK